MKLKPQDIYKTIEKDYIANCEVNKALSMFGYAHAINLMHRKSKLYLDSKVDLRSTEINNNLLLLGKSGSGKTYGTKLLVKALNKLLGIEIPYLLIDCTLLTPSGYKGDDLDSKLKSFCNKHQNNPYLDFSIIVFDEFDKLTMEAGADDGFYKRVQYQLLKMLEGEDNNIPDLESKMSHVDINTFNMSFIFCGNFPQIRHKRVKEKKASMGFGLSDSPTSNTTLEIATLVDELERSGVASQLVGRLSSVAETEEMTYEILSKIFDIRAKLYYNFLNIPRSQKIKAKLKKELINTCLDTDTGARALDSRISSVLNEVIYEADLEFEVEEPKKEPKTDAKLKKSKLSPLEIRDGTTSYDWVSIPPSNGNSQDDMDLKAHLDKIIDNLTSEAETEEILEELNYIYDMIGFFDDQDMLSRTLLEDLFSYLINHLEIDNQDLIVVIEEKLFDAEKRDGTFSLKILNDIYEEIKSYIETMET